MTCFGCDAPKNPASRGQAPPIEGEGIAVEARDLGLASRSERLGLPGLLQIPRPRGQGPLGRLRSDCPEREGRGGRGARMRGRSPSWYKQNFTYDIQPLYALKSGSQSVWPVNTSASTVPSCCCFWCLQTCLKCHEAPSPRDFVPPGILRIVEPQASGNPWFSRAILIAWF